MTILYDATGAVTGEGTLTLTHSGIVGYVWCNVDDPGPAEQLDTFTLTRYAKLGWWSLLNVVASDPIGRPDGNYLHELRWLVHLQEKWISENPGGFDPSGDDQFFYHLYPGVTARFWVGQI